MRRRSAPPGPRLMLPVLLAAPFMAQADATIVNVANPSIHAGLHATGAQLELVVGGYMIAFAMMLITGARLGEMYGYRRTFIAGFAVFTAASLGAGLAYDPIVLIAARVVQGLGAALMFPQVLTGIQRRFSGPARARAIGHYAAALSIGAVSGQLLGGLLISAPFLGAGDAWRSIFLINVPIGLLVIAAALRVLPPDDLRTRRPLDLPGVASLAAAVLLLVLPLTLGPQQRWPAWTWCSLAISLPVFAAFWIGRRRRTHGALLDAAQLARRPVALGLLALAAATGTYYTLLFTLAQYLQGGLGRSALVSGLALVPWVAAFGLAGQVLRRLPPRIAGRMPAYGCLLLAAAYAAIGAVSYAGDHGVPVLAPLLAAGGFGLGLNFSAMIRHLTETVPVEHAPDISGVSSTVMQIGGAVALAGFGGLYLTLTRSAGVAHAFAATTGALALTALATAAAAHLATTGRR